MTIPRGSHLSECQFCHVYRPVYKEGRRHGCEPERQWLEKYNDLTRGLVAQPKPPRRPPTGEQSLYGGDKDD